MSELLSPAELADLRLGDDDVYTLIGHAEVLRQDGHSDMPTYLFRLAAGIALTIGDKALAQRAIEIWRNGSAL